MLLVLLLNCLLLVLQVVFTSAYTLNGGIIRSNSKGCLLTLQVLAATTTSNIEIPNKNRKHNKGVTITAPFYLDPEKISNDQQHSSILHNIHVEPCLSKREATTCLKIAKEYAATTGCWDRSTGRHANYETVDFEVEESDTLSEYLNEIGFHNRITQQLSDAYDIDWNYITFLDLFCSNYEAKQHHQNSNNDNDSDNNDNQRETMDSLVMHRDGSLLSFTVILSDPQVDFDGGGTTFECLKNADLTSSLDASSTTIVRVCSKNGTVQPQKQGYCTLHSGKMLHGADLTTRGSRCVLVGFMDVAPFVTESGRFGEACKQWGRLDVMKKRYQWQQKKTSPTWLLQNSKFLPKKNISHLQTLGIAFPSVTKRANEVFQRQQRLITEDWLLRGILLPHDQRDPTSMFGMEDGDITIL